MLSRNAFWNHWKKNEENFINKEELIETAKKEIANSTEEILRNLMRS